VIPDARDQAVAAYRIRASNTTAVQLRSILGASQSMVSMILGGQRALSKKAIAKLAEHFSVDPAYFL
jgi:antitoxin component HigA of HigAB toxin-antitoxin module